MRMDNSSKIFVMLLIILAGLHVIFIHTIKKNSRTDTYPNLTVSRLSLDELRYQHEKKVILLWTDLDWFDDYTKLREKGCTSWRCEFTTNRSRLNESDALLFESSETSSLSNANIYHNTSQVWIRLDIEAPTESFAIRNFQELQKYKLDKQVNWTMSYHRNADISIGYGCFLLLNQKARPLRAHFMSSYPETMGAYMVARAKGITLEEVMGSDWKYFVDRPRLVSWMSSHCQTNSKREEYVAELQKYVDVDTYGSCGTKKCYKRHPRRTICWETILRPNYLFYMAMENNLCQDYASEKLYMALDNGLVPIVYGGANYSDLLPPSSFIDARKYHPRDLAKLLLELKKDPVKNGRYHVWRYLWKTNNCVMYELCDKLHRDITPKHYQDIQKFRLENGKCFNPPSQLFKNEEWKKYFGKDRQQF